MIRMFAFTAVATALLLFPSGASAQDSRWEPWLGCWERVTTDLREAIQPGGALTGEDNASASAAPRVCVTRSGDTAVTLTTTVPNQPPIEQTLVPDGQPHPIAENECRGAEGTEWSSNGLRLFARAEVTCGDGSTREISGLAMLTAEGEWLDIRSIRFGDIPSTRVSRYRRVTPDASLRIPQAAGTPLSLAEIKEAATKVTPAVLEAAIVETNPYLPVSRHTLTDLADSGVAPTVLDVIVALAYPDRFIVERTGDIVAARAPAETTGRTFGIDDYYYTGYYYPAYYYSPFGYSYIGLWDPFLFGSGFGYIGGPIRGGGGSLDPQPTGTARAVNREGYTRIRPGDSAEVATSVARPRSESGGDSGGSRGSARSDSSSSDRPARTRTVVTPGGFSGGGGGGSSSGGSSSGGSSSDGGGGGGGGGGGRSSDGGGGGGGGRTAVPR